MKEMFEAGYTKDQVLGALRILPFVSRELAKDLERVIMLRRVASSDEARGARPQESFTGDGILLSLQLE